MIGSRRRFRFSRRTLCWFISFVLLSFIGFNVAVDFWQPHLYDAEYIQRRDLLRQQIADKPDSPLCVVLGSSRAAMAFHPEWLPSLKDDSGQDVIAFNFGCFGASPPTNLVHFRRLLRDDIRPRWLVLEVIPAHLSKDGDPFLRHFLGLRELRLARDCMTSARLARLYATRRFELAPRLPALLLGRGDKTQRPLDKLGGYQAYEDVNDQKVRDEKMKLTQVHYRAALEQFRIARGADRAIRAVIKECRRHNIEVVVFVPPEGSLIRSWYSAQAESLLINYLDKLKRETAATVIDARRWLDDRDFSDDHHTFQHGAEKFTRRFHADVLSPLVRSRPSATQTLAFRFPPLIMDE